MRLWTRARDWAASGPGLAAGRGLVRLLGASLRVTEVNWAAVERLWATGGPVLYAVWHGRMLLVPPRYAGRRRFHVLTSRSRDGELLSRFVAGFGVTAVRGSSSRGAGAALLALARLLRHEAAHVVVVPDGPARSSSPAWGARRSYRWGSGPRPGWSFPRGIGSSFRIPSPARPSSSASPSRWIRPPIARHWKRRGRSCRRRSVR